MSKSTTPNPEAPSGTSSTDTATDTDTAVITEPLASDLGLTNNRVFVIESSYHFRDRDNRDVTEDEILVNEGWFADKASAEIRRDQLNASSRTLYDQAIEAEERTQNEKIRRAKEFNREAAVLRDAGMTKADIVVPPAYTPPTYERFLNSTNHTSHTVVEVSRADHDGIAQAIAAKEAEARSGDRA